ncbi:MAG: DUF2493 domain-containing protein [Kouleothrix sp.]|jgi:aromatic ring-cleaving dioxygenase|nr:DUF2493 domain-containing protein [Kouleothrix sp.]
MYTHTTPLRVLVTGATDWSDRECIRRELTALPPGSIIIHGDTPGADALAGEIAARELGLTVVAMYKSAADRTRYGTLAWQGLNERMLQQGVDLVLAFHPALDDPAQAHGTRHAISCAQALGITVRVIAR